jgi:hypothetical protein
MFGGGGDPCGEGKGDGGAAALTVESFGRTGAALAFFLGGGVWVADSVIVSIPCIMPSVSYDRFLAKRSTASMRPTDLEGPAPSSDLTRRHPLPPITSSSCKRSSASSLSRKVAREPFGKTRGNWRNEGGNGAFKSGYFCGSWGVEGVGRVGNGMGA